MKRPALILLLLGPLNTSFAATITVTTFGALGNGIADDTAAIQRASDACSEGTTLLFPAGNYRVKRPVIAHSGCGYVGAVGAAISGYTGTGDKGFSLFQTDASSVNITFSGLTMNGGGINLNGAGWSDHIIITNNTFQNLIHSNGVWGPFYGAIYCSGWGMQNTTITNNTFQNQFFGGNNNLTEPDDPTTAVMCGHVNSVTIADNKFDYLNEGIHIVQTQEAPPHDNDLKIQRNIFTRIHRMPIEIQRSTLTNILIEDNSITNYLNPFWNSFGISVGAAPGGIVRRNFLVIDVAATGWMGYCMELMGAATSLLADGNVCEAVGQGRWYSAVAIGPYTHNAVISNNIFCGAVVSGTVYEPRPNGTFGTASFTNNSTLPNCSGVLPPTTTTTKRTRSGVQLK